jgi:hypothetical protein
MTIGFDVTGVSQALDTPTYSYATGPVVAQVTGDPSGLVASMIPVWESDGHSWGADAGPGTEFVGVFTPRFPDAGLALAFRLAPASQARLNQAYDELHLNFSAREPADGGLISSDGYEAVVYFRHYRAALNSTDTLSFANQTIAFGVAPSQ